MPAHERLSSTLSGCTSQVEGDRSILLPQGLVTAFAGAAGAARAIAVATSGVVAGREDGEVDLRCPMEDVMESTLR